MLPSTYKAIELSNRTSNSSIKLDLQEKRKAEFKSVTKINQIKTLYRHATLEDRTLSKTPIPD